MITLYKHTHTHQSLGADRNLKLKAAIRSATSAGPQHRVRRLTLTLSVFVIAAFLLLSAGSSASAQVETVLHSFDDGSVTNDGENPYPSLIQATDGNFYGTTEVGGSADSGTVFKITPLGVVTILHSFADGSVTNDGEIPEAGLIQATDGNLYGTTHNGGSNGYGAVFEITLLGTVTILHSFHDGSVANDGTYPEAGLIQATDGNFYGTTASGGSGVDGDGTVFEMTPAGSVTILHLFGDGPDDGISPRSGLIQASNGDFYGTTYEGGSAGYGSVFEISSDGSMTILHSFDDESVTNDGTFPVADLIQASDGNFYGTTDFGGTADGGTVFEITPAGSVTILHSFGDGSVAYDGEYPNATLIQASDGNFYGTTEEGGSVSDGTVFRITSAGSVTILHSFGDGSVPHDGANPDAGLIQANDGDFYGTTLNGGSAAKGTVFEFTPATSVPSPVLSSLSPTSATAGSAAFTLTVNGSKFVSKSVVRWNGTALSTAYVSATKLTATVPASSVATFGTASVTVFTSAPGGGTSTAATFTIAAPSPVLSSISPTSALAGSAAFTLTVTGSKFVSKSVVHWNGAELRTTFVSSTKLTATVPTDVLTSAGTASVTAFTPAPGGGTSKAATFTIENPVPVLSSISPTSALAGSAKFTLTVNGSKFVSKSVVRWNGSALTTTYVSSTKLTATVPASSIATAGTASVTVFSPTPGGGTSKAATFTIENPVPVLSSISPKSVVAHSARCTLTVNGSKFVPRSVVHWKGVALPTTYVSATKLTATVAADLLTTAGTAAVTVFTSTPGGGTSKVATFTIGK